jgi:hypothetical protein
VPDRYYRGATIRPRRKGGNPHGWWLLPEGPLEEHPDKGWVRTIDEARREIDSHLTKGPCLMSEGRRWLGVLAEHRKIADSMFTMTILSGFSPWCAGRRGKPHEPCSTRGCPCECHQGATT